MNTDAIIKDLWDQIYQIRVEMQKNYGNEDAFSELSDKNQELYNSINYYRGLSND